MEEIQEIDIKEYGSKQWFRQHEQLDRLNIQAHKNAMGGSDEYVMEAFVTGDKISHLIHTLLSAEAWKEKIFPKISGHVAKMSSFKSYICIYHEASICNLLEVLLYHRTAISSDEDSLVELIDYCYRKMVNMTYKAKDIEYKQNNKPEPLDAKKLLAQTPKDELEK